MLNTATRLSAPLNRLNQETWRPLVLLLACATLLYSRSLTYDFVYDDILQIVKNPRITAWSCVPSYFTEQLWSGIQSASYYRPLLLVWMRINHFLFGLNPVGWHTTSVLLHVGATAVAFFLARRLLKNCQAALVVAAIFTLHPLQVESVAWLSAANESLSAIFIFACYLLFLKSLDEAGQVRSRRLSVLMFALALLTKETAAVVPVMIVLFAFLYFRPVPDKNKRVAFAFRAAIPYVVILTVYVITRKLVLSQRSLPDLRASPLDALYTAPSVAWLYLRHLIVPWRLAMVYDTPYVGTLWSTEFWIPMLLLIAVGVVGWWLWRKTRSSFVGIAFFWVCVHLTIPLLALPLFRNVDLSHDRYLYLPLFGFALLIGYARLQLRNIGLGKVILTALFGLYAVATFTQEQYWRDNAALYARAMQVSPGAYLAKVLEGQELAGQKRYTEAVPLLEASLRQQPQALAGLVGLAFTRCEMGEPEIAENLFARALTLQPGNPETNYVLGLCRLARSDTAGAILPLQVAVNRFPGGFEYRLTLGRALVLAGRTQEGIRQLQAAEALAPETERPALRGYIDRLSGRY
jgi:4-amino-4-deoxy-L-arabinose transferase-like glycosyltransferase